MSEQGTDLIVSELLSELKTENNRKDAQIRGLHRVIIVAFASLLLVIAGFLWYLNQYDFSSTTTENITNSAEGVYAIVDSEGNVIGSDFTAKEIQSFLEGVNTDGESNEK